MTKGTTSKGKRHNKSHIICRRCNHSSFHVQKHTCAHCGYPAARIRNTTCAAPPPCAFWRPSLPPAPAPHPPTHAHSGLVPRGDAARLTRWGSWELSELSAGRVRLPLGRRGHGSGAAGPQCSLSAPRELHGHRGAQARGPGGHVVDNHRAWWSRGG